MAVAKMTRKTVWRCRLPLPLAPLPLVPLLPLLLLLLPLAGCSSVSSFFSGSDKTAEVGNAPPPEQLYSSADQLLSAGKFEKAAEKFEEVDREHPYAPQARRALVMAAYAYYRDGKYNEAIKAAKRYTTLHPGTKEAALAHHVIAMSYFNRINDADRDQTWTKKALREFQILVRRYPESRYAKEAQNRIRICKDVLAASEMKVGRYYLRKGNYLAAINRFKAVVVNYQTTRHVEEALARLTEAYMALGIKSEAQTAAAVLGHNFPESKWYKDSYTLLQSDGLAPREDTGSWISRAWKGAVKSVSKLNPL